MSIKFMGIDPATQTGYAWRDRVAWCVGTVKMGDPHYLEVILDHAVTHGVTHAAIEDCFLGKNVGSLKVLARIQERICAACENAGIITIMVNNATWKSYMLPINGHIPKDRKGQKARAIWVATHALGIDISGTKTQQEDMADAACICEYASKVLVREMEN